MSFVGSVSWNFLKSFVKAVGTVVAVALVPEVAIVLLLLGEAKYAGCAIITYFPEDLFDSDLWHKIYNYADKEMSGLAEVSRVALERGPLGLIGYLGQGYADKVQTPEGIASTTGEVCGTVAGTLGVKNLLSPEGQAGTSDVDDVEAGGIGDTEVGGVGDVEAGNVGDVEAGGVGDTTPGNISDTEAGKITDIEAGSGDTNITICGSNVSVRTQKNVSMPVLPEGSQWERNVLNSFAGGKSTPVTYGGGTTLYRVGGKNGGFWSLDAPPLTEYQWRVDCAIKQEFCNDASTLYKITIPESSSISGLEGRVGTQGMGLYGGAHQIYLDYRAVPSDWIEITPTNWER